MSKSSFPLLSPDPNPPLIIPFLGENLVIAVLQLTKPPPNIGDKNKRYYITILPINPAVSLMLVISTIHIVCKTDRFILV